VYFKVKERERQRLVLYSCPWKRGLCACVRVTASHTLAAGPAHRHRAAVLRKDANAPTQQGLPWVGTSTSGCPQN
jgi:hypothetical protein